MDDNPIIRNLSTSRTCYDSDLHTIFNFVWNDYNKVVLKKVTNIGQYNDQQEQDYVLMYKTDKAHAER